MGGDGRNRNEILGKTKEVWGKSKIRNPRREDSRHSLLRAKKRGLKRRERREERAQDTL